MSPKLKLGISACLMGESVRFDGQHKKDTFLLESLAAYVDWVPVCPEVEMGLGVPRPSIRLVKLDGRTRALMGERDITPELENYAVQKIASLQGVGLRGYVLKKNSPSCGMARVRVYGETGTPHGTDSGVFSGVLMRAFSDLPVEEEGRLRDDAIRENFLERVFAYDRLLAFFSKEWTLGGLVAFHTAHKLQLLAHAPETYRELGRIVAEAKAAPAEQVQKDYTRRFMEALSVQASKGRNTNTLEHMAGYLKHKLPGAEKKELSAVIRDYRLGWVPLVVPLTLLGHYVRKFQIQYLLGQSYLEPHPRELMLRNHVR